jgi:flagellar basal-body rod modification protein FlgD
MSTVSDLTSTATTTASTTSSSSMASLAEDFDGFLELLTIQLQNQSPLDPMDATEFTNQLVQFASVEQEIETNDNLELLNTNITAFGTSAALGFIGQTVTVAGDTAPLTDDGATWTYDLDSEAAAVTLTLSDEDGTVVATYEGSGAAGSNSFTWDGTTATGDQAPAGNYTLTVAAIDSTGAAIASDTFVSSKVTGVETSDGDVLLDLSTLQVSMTDVQKVAA